MTVDSIVKIYGNRQSRTKIMRKPADWFADADKRLRELEQKMALDPKQTLSPDEARELTELQQRCQEELQRCYTKKT